MRQNTVKQVINHLIEVNILALVLFFPLMHLGFRGVFTDLWVSLLGLWVLHKILTHQETGFHLPPSGRMLLASVAAVLLSVVFSESVLLSLDTSLHFLKGVGLSIVVFDYYSVHSERMKRLISFILFSALIVSLDALYQVVFAKDIAGVPMNWIRATAFFTHPFYLSLWAVVGIFLATLRLLETSSTGHRIFYSAGMLVMGAALIFSKTRAAWIALAAMLFSSSIFLTDRKRILKVLLILLVLVMILFAADESFRSRTLSIFKADDLRWTIWQQSYTAILQKFSLPDWFLGRGPGIFRLEYPEFDLIQERSTFPHLIALELLYASGIAGAAGYFFWFGHYLVRLVSLIKHHGREFRLYFIGFMPLLIFLVCFINESYFSRYFSFTFWFFAGMSFAVMGRAEKAGVPGAKTAHAIQDTGLENS
jgi:hypothetical protein